jgi:hypothetical protein
VRAAVAGAVVVVAAALAGCGGSSGISDRRSAVNAYFVRVDEVEAPLLQGSAAINQAFARFSVQQNPPAEVRALVRARSLLASTVTQVRALTPPPDAVKVHADLVEVLRRETAVAAELVSAAQFLPQFAAATAPLGEAASTLSDALHTTKTLTADAQAFAAYRGELEAALARLGRLAAPPVLGPLLYGERETLQRSVTTVRSVEAAFTAGDVAAANAGIRTLGEVAASPTSPRARKTLADAAEAYNARLRAIERLAARVQRERLRLVSAIG